MLVKFDSVENAFTELIQEYNIEYVYTNRDYDTYSKSRDKKIEILLSKYKIGY